MYAVIEIGGQQFKIQKGSCFTAEGFQSAKDGASVDIKKALLIKEGNTVHVGAPYVKGAAVTCKILRHVKSRKVVAFKFKRRKSSKRKTGSRRHMAELEVKEISIGK